MYKEGTSSIIKIWSRWGMWRTLLGEYLYKGVTTSKNRNDVLVW